MMKRELEGLTGSAVDIDAPRPKRRKDGTIEEVDVVMGETVPDMVQVREDGTKLWTTIREAVNKEGRTLSNDFFRLPSKRQYADYYQQTKHPISLEDIKTRLDSGQYHVLEAVKLDLETCFRNAKKYNMKDSQIWKDAKHLHKLVTREYAKMTGTADDPRVDVENDGDDNAAAPGASDDEGGKKKKAPNLTRLLKSRLQKLIDKTDDTGRVLSSEFMDLPNKKQWPVYYKAIKKPQCLENIFKRLKRKEYHTSLDFSRDVELVFSNAMEFNAENSQIYEDARILREYFYQLISDLPSPHTVPEYPSHVSGSKIMLKVPAASSPYPSTSTAPAVTNNVTSAKSSGSVLLRVPGLHTNSSDNQQSSQSYPGTAHMSPPVVTQKLPPVAIPRTTTHIIPHQLTPSISYASTSHYPNASYQHQSVEHPTPTSAFPSISPLIPAIYGDVNSHANLISHALSKSPVPVPIRTFRCMLLTTKPRQRKLELDHREGVKVWAMRLGNNETALSVTAIRFTTDEEEEDDSEERRESDREEEEEEEEEVPEVKVKGRGRRKGKGKATSKVTKTSAKRRKLSPAQDEEISIRINGSVVQAKPGSLGEWDVDVPLGSSVLDVSEKGGAVWKVYLDRNA